MHPKTPVSPAAGVKGLRGEHGRGPSRPGATRPSTLRPLRRWGGSSGLVARAPGLQRTTAGGLGQGLPRPSPSAPGHLTKAALDHSFKREQVTVSSPSYHGNPQPRHRLPGSPRWQPPQEEPGTLGSPPSPRRPMGPLAISRGWQVPQRGAGCWESGPPPLEVSAVARGPREGTLVVLPTHTRGKAEPPSLACPHQTWNPGRRGLRSGNPGLAGGQPHLGGVGPASQTVSEARWKGLGSSGGFRGTCRGAGARSHMHVTSHRVGGLLPSRGLGQVLVWPGGFLGWGGVSSL